MLWFAMILVHTQYNGREKLVLPHIDTVGEPPTLKRLKLQSERFALEQQKVLPTRLRRAQC